MADYHKMYLHLFNEVTRAIVILQDAQTTAEELYLDATESPIELAGLRESLEKMGAEDKKPEGE